MVGKNGWKEGRKEKQEKGEEREGKGGFREVVGEHRGEEEDGERW